jgi:hypothetical protein
MGDFSRSPKELLDESLKKGYVGLHIEQGVPVLDRDLNLLHDLIATLTRKIVARYIGDGIAVGHDGFKIAPADGDNDFQILAGPSSEPGICLVDGIEVVIDKATPYSAQKLPDGQPMPKLTAPPGPPSDDRSTDRTDTVFLDIWLTEVDGSVADHEALRNPDDVGMQTSVRIRREWRVRVAEDAADPPPSPRDSGHVHYPLATLIRPRGNEKITEGMIIDRRQRRLTLTDLEQRVQTMELLRLQPRFSGPAPFSPPFGAPPTEVELSGRNFDVGAVAVRFGTKLATEVDVQSSTKITATLPAGLRPGLVPITVETTSGTVVSEKAFKVVGQRPKIDSFTPPSGNIETSTTPATKVTITGSHLDENIGDEKTIVEFGEKDPEFEAKVESVTATKVVVFVPLSASAGEHIIFVRTSSGSGQSSARFTVRVPS